MSERPHLSTLIDGLKKQRDELAVQIHLGKEEAKDEWEKVAAKFDGLIKDYEPLKGAVEEAAENISDALKLVAGEIEEGFKRIRKKL